MKRQTALAFAVLIAVAAIAVTIWLSRSFMLVGSRTVISPTHSPLESPLPTPVERKEIDVVKLAIDYSNANLPDSDGQPEVVLVRPLSASEFPELGLGTVGFGGSEPPMKLVLLQGDFKSKGFGVGNKVSFERASCILIVLDLNTGMAFDVTIAENCAEFDKLIKAPTPTPELTPAMTR